MRQTDHSGGHMQKHSFLHFILFFFSIALLSVILTLSVSAITADGKIVVVLDPGHGGNSTGTCEGGEPEYYYNMIVAEACREVLESTGKFKVYMTHTDNAVTMEHWERLLVADGVNADLCFSIHFNGNDITSLNGTETFVSVVERFSLPGLGKKVQEKLVSTFGFKDLGVIARYDTGDGESIYYWDNEQQWDIPDERSLGMRSDYFGIITWGCKFGMPSVIVEHCYMSNPGDREIATKHENLLKMGQLDAQAIIEFYTQHEHIWSEERMTDYPANCLYDGKASYVCKICLARKDTISTGPADDGGHIWLVSSEKKASCTRDGGTEYYCRICDNFIDKGRTDLTLHKKSVKVSALGHDYEITDEVKVTHTTDGYTTYRCSRCKDTYTENFKAEGHSIADVSRTVPTCTEDGVYTTHCTVCGEVFRDVTPALGHIPETVTRVEATCTADGTHLTQCRRCNYQHTEVLPAIGHDKILEEEILPDCENSGLRRYVCKNCGLTEEEYMAHLEHSDLLETEILPLCDESGYRKYICSRCQRERTEELSPTGHSWQLTATEDPVCEEDGLETYLCLSCAEKRFESIAATGHSWMEVERAESGVFEAGSILYRCENDRSHEYTEELPAWVSEGYNLYILVGGVTLGLSFILLLVIALVRHHRDPIWETEEDKKTDDPEKDEKTDDPEENEKQEEAAEETSEKTV